MLSMLLRSATGFRQLLSFRALCLGALALFPACADDCADVPLFSLSAAQRAWAAPYTTGDVLRFRNDAGYERTYRVQSTTQTRRDMGSLGTNGPSCPDYTREYTEVRLVRTDSVAAPAESVHALVLAATNPYEPFHATLQWGSSIFTAPLLEIEEGRLILGSISLAGRQYSRVLVLSDDERVAGPVSPPRVVAVYLTKAEGIVSFRERNEEWSRR